MANNIFKALDDAYSPPAQPLTDEQRRTSLRRLSAPDLVVTAAMQAGQAACLHLLRNAGCVDPLVGELATVVARDADLIEAEFKRRGIKSPFGTGKSSH